MGRFTRVIGGQPRIEHIMRWARSVRPRFEGLDGFLEMSPGHDSFVYVCGVAPRNGEGPVALPVIADGLLQHAGLVAGRRLHEVAGGFETVHAGKYWFHPVEFDL
ncbi:UNVERIFIED_CONTAM: hypothetical protein Sindi_1051600 [Sesamum indicum]